MHCKGPFGTIPDVIIKNSDRNVQGLPVYGAERGGLSCALLLHLREHGGRQRSLYSWWVHSMFSRCSSCLWWVHNAYHPWYYTVGSTLRPWALIILVAFSENTSFSVLMMSTWMYLVLFNDVLTIIFSCSDIPVIYLIILVIGCIVLAAIVGLLCMCLCK